MNHDHPYQDFTPISKEQFEAAGLMHIMTDDLRMLFCKGQFKIWHSFKTNKISIWDSETNDADSFFVYNYRDFLKQIEKHGINTSTYVNRFEVDINDEIF